MNCFRPALSAALLVCTVVASYPVLAQSPRRLPPPGITLPDADRASLQAECEALATRLHALSHPTKADAEIYFKAVDWALRYDEFFDLKHVEVARRLLETCRERIAHLEANNTPWTTSTGRVVLAYTSRIDGSIQPFAMVVPEDWGGPTDTRPRPLWVWNQGRNDKRTELAFIDERTTKNPEFTPLGAFVLLPFGRYCNATKLAGEMDVFEALHHAKARYPIDENRIVNGGFSMGGASAWHLAVHHPGRWVASTAGAGFSDTPEYTGALNPSKPQPEWFRKTLWNWYDATRHAGNLFNHPMIAYSGDRDKQKLASDAMLREAEKEGITFERLLGPNTEHKYEPNTKQQIIERIAGYVGRGKNSWPREIRYTLHTLRYPTIHWITVDGLLEHWQRADIRARATDAGVVEISTRNIASFILNVPPDFPSIPTPLRTATIDGQSIPFTSSRPRFVRGKESWALATTPDTDLRKRPGLTGPIDDAFLDAFLFVRPTGTPWNSTTAGFLEKEMALKREQWRHLFRGEVRVIDDIALTPDDLERFNLVVWGDPSSNAVLGRMAEQLLVRWTPQGVGRGAELFSSEHHVPMLVQPNPLNPKKYLVINSGVTFRGAGNGTNANQVPTLPDWAIIDVRGPETDFLPGPVPAAGFFDEFWR
jgi:hypothetical protein